MEIKILDLKLKNFKGIKDLEIVFDGRNTNIYGKNATGKTTIFDAFKWLFFDKDSSDRKDFNIKTLDSNNNSIHFLEHEVESTLIIDGVDTTFKKVFKEKWVKKRGQEGQEFSGHETNYWIDEVPIKKKDYEEKINNLIPENLFKMITDPTYFNNQMKWQERRELLMSISKSNVSDDEILDSKEEFKILKENLAGRSIDDYKKILTERIKKLNDERKEIPTRIDEASKNLKNESELELVKFDELENEKVKLQKEIEEIENSFLDIQKRARDNNQLINTLSDKKLELIALKNKLENEQKISLSNKKIEISNKINEIKSKIQQKQDNLENIKLLISNFEKQRNELRNKWNEINSRVFKKPLDGFICPTCKQKLPEEQKQQKLEELKNNFEKQKQLEIEAVNVQGMTAKEQQEKNELNLTNIKVDIEKLRNELQELNQLEVQNDNDLNSLKEINLADNEDYTGLLKEVEKLEIQVSNITNETIDEGLRESKKRKQEEIDRINATLVDRNNILETQARISTLKEKEKEISKEIQELESQQFQIEEFIKTKVELLESNINSKFEIVKFRLFKTQINGGLEECCDTLVNGVPYPDVNNAHKIIAGLDIIQTLSKFRDTIAPIFIDNRESINSLCTIDAQIISLIVTEDTKLRIEVI